MNRIPEPEPTPAPTPDPKPAPQRPSVVNKVVGDIVAGISSATTAASVARFIRDNIGNFIRRNSSDAMELDRVGLADQVEANFSSELTQQELNVIRNAELEPWEVEEAAQLRNWLVQYGGSGYEEGIAAAEPFEMLTAEELAVGGFSEAAAVEATAVEAVEATEVLLPGAEALAAITPTASTAIASVGAAAAETVSAVSAGAAATLAEVGGALLEYLPFLLFL